MTKTFITNKKPYLEWLGTIEKTFDGNKLISAIFYKQKIKTGEERGTSITDETAQILNNGLLERPGTFHTIWVLDTENNRKNDPIKLDLDGFNGPEY